MRIFAIILFFPLLVYGQGVKKDKVVIGVSAPLSGPAAAWGGVAKGLKAYIDYINEKGGIHGRKIDLIIKDDGYQPSRTLANIKEMMDKVLLFVGILGTANVQAVADIIAEGKVPVIYPLGNPRIFLNMPEDKRRYFFVIYPDYISEAQYFTHFAINELKSEKIAVFYQNDDYGKAGLEGVKNIAKDRVVAEVSYEIGEKDFSTHAKKLRESKADTLIIYANPTATAGIIKSIKPEWNPKIIASFTVGDPIMFALLGDLWEGVYVGGGLRLPGTSAKVDEILGIITRYDESLKKMPNIALYGANMGIFLEKALELAGKDLSREKIVKVLEGLRDFETPLLPAKITFSERRRHGSNSIALMLAEKGKYRIIKDVVEFPPLF